MSGLHVFTICIEEGQQNAYAQMYALQRKTLSEVDVQTFLEKSLIFRNISPYPATTYETGFSYVYFCLAKQPSSCFKCNVNFFHLYEMRSLSVLEWTMLYVGPYYVILKRTFHLVVTVAAQSF